MVFWILIAFLLLIIVPIIVFLVFVGRHKEEPLDDSFDFDSTVWDCPVVAACETEDVEEEALEEDMEEDEEPDSADWWKN